jgi:hypothetical protein
MNEAPQIAPRGLCAVRVCDYCGAHHNAEMDLYVTENWYAIGYDNLKII